MRLFRRRASDLSELDELKDRITSMADRLAAADAAAAEREQRVADLHDQVQRVSIAPVEAPTGSIDPVEHPEIDVLRARIERLNQRIDPIAHATDRQPPAESVDLVTLRDEFERRLAEVVARLDQPADAPGTRSDEPPEWRDQLDQRLVELDRQIAPLVAGLAGLTDRLDANEQRLSSVATELANQLDELGRDIDQARPDSDDGQAEQRLVALLEQTASALRDSQTRLAAEQARYQIAFRRDLAELAERLPRR